MMELLDSGWGTIPPAALERSSMVNAGAVTRVTKLMNDQARTPHFCARRPQTTGLQVNGSHERRIIEPRAAPERNTVVLDQASDDPSPVLRANAGPSQLSCGDFF
jgi:hypothetical protein